MILTLTLTPPVFQTRAQINRWLCIFQVQEDEWLEQDSEQVFVIEGAGLKRLVTDEKVKINFLNFPENFNTIKILPEKDQVSN